jgi:hypothetical protein
MEIQNVGGACHIGWGDSRVLYGPVVNALTNLASGGLASSRCS